MLPRSATGVVKVVIGIVKLMVEVEVEGVVEMEMVVVVEIVAPAVVVMEVAAVELRTREVWGGSGRRK
jgi:hypothetical protein